MAKYEMPAEKYTPADEGDTNRQITFHGQYESPLLLNKKAWR
jgi:hypothetical protein